MSDIISEEIERLKKENYAYRIGVSGETLTTFGSGGPVAIVVYPENVKRLLALEEILRGIPRLVMGGGSNVLLPSAGFAGAIVKLDAFRGERACGRVLEVGAGVKMPRLSAFAKAARLSGVEFASGIPGTVGGAIRTNASAFGQAISDGLSFVTALVGNKIERLSPSELGFSHHRAKLPKDSIVLSAAFALEEGDGEKIGERIRSMREKRLQTQPQGRSAGSVFRKCGSVPAAIYIEKTGLKGLKIGGARLSEKHCNFIVNEGGASSEDFFEIGETVRKKVAEEQGVLLEYEVEKIGW
ncbi:MAG: UDP-N-acetylmuramate dehydrogenase [Clostridia bacterium]|nr:UDP-N-acetylmuramate dehydrogenase [Clostridia bacterium]